MGNNINSVNSLVNNQINNYKTEKISKKSNELTETTNKKKQISNLDTTSDSSYTYKGSRLEENTNKKQKYKKIFEWKGNGNEVCFKSPFLSNFNSNMNMKQVEKETFQYETLLEEGTYFFYFQVDGHRKLSDYYLKKVLSDGKEYNMIIINSKSFSNELLSINSQPPMLVKEFILPIDNNKPIPNSQLDHLIINDFSCNQVNDDCLYISSVSQRIRHKKMQFIYYSYFNLDDKSSKD